MGCLWASLAGKSPRLSPVFQIKMLGLQFCCVDDRLSLTFKYFLIVPYLYILPSQQHYQSPVDEVTGCAGRAWVPVMYSICVLLSMDDLGAESPTSPGCGEQRCRLEGSGQCLACCHWSISATFLSGSSPLGSYLSFPEHWCFARELGDILGWASEKWTQGSWQ